ncbi:MAG: hypothetical protein LBG44_10650 [Gemmatimonadota bacterium]|jgi:hypothetical protein|nr:hypothetical protein [Gemmatimonadota bacterium]
MDERGAALPMAIFGLVILSFLGTFAIESASMEMTLSRSRFNGIRGLFEADAAIEVFVAGLAEELAAGGTLGSGEYLVDLPGGEGFRVIVSLLYRGENEGSGDSTPFIETTEVLSIIASPGEGWGRAAAALVEVSRTGAPDSDTDSAGIAGGSARTDDDATVPELTAEPLMNTWVIKKPTFGWFEVTR